MQEMENPLMLHPYSAELFGLFHEMSMGNFAVIDMKQDQITHIACLFVADVMVSGAIIIDVPNLSYATIQCFCTRKSMHRNGYGTSMIRFIENHYVDRKDVHAVVANDAADFYDKRSSFELKNRSNGCCDHCMNCKHFVFKCRIGTTPSKYPTYQNPSQQQLTVFTEVKRSETNISYHKFRLQCGSAPLTPNHRNHTVVSSYFRILTYIALDT